MLDELDECVDLLNLVSAGFDFRKLCGFAVVAVTRVDVIPFRYISRRVNKALKIHFQLDERMLECQSVVPTSIVA
jgi:hypothetical protein